MATLLKLREWMRFSWWGSILAEHDTEPTELAGGMLKLTIGGWLLLPFPTFSTSSTFAQLTIAPEWFWGLVLFCVGLGHLLAVRDGYRSWRRAASMLGFLVWFVLGCAALWFNPVALGFPLFMLLAAGQGWAYIRLGTATA